MGGEREMKKVKFSFEDLIKSIKKSMD